MTLRFKSILCARLCGSPAVPNPHPFRLYERPGLSLCKYSQQQRQKPRYQQRIRWFSAEGSIISNSGPGSPNPSGVSNAPPSQPEFRNLPSQKESRRPNVSRKFSAAMDDLQTAMFTAGQKLNEITGYSEIEALKKSIEQQESHVNASRQAVQSAKEQYQAAIKRRSASQREVNEMALRRHVWEPADLERFTELYRSDHANEQAEVSAQELLAQAERVAEEAQAGLARAILSRYHEEQIWSDKIRRASTWGTWGLMSFNVLLFIVVQLGLEPWKRRRLVGGFEEKVRGIVQEEALRRDAPPATHIREGGPGGGEGGGGGGGVGVGGYTAAPGPSSDKITAAQGPEGTAFASQDPTVISTAIDVPETTVEESDVPLEEIHVEESDVEGSRILQEGAAEGTAEENHLDKDDRQWLGRLRGGVSDKARDLFSERVVPIKQVDLTKRELKAVGIGAVITAAVCLLLLR